MNTYRGTGHRRSYTNATSTAIESGDVVVMGVEIGIAVTDIAATGDTGDTGEVEVSGLHELAAETADEWDQGAQLYWNGTALTDTASGNDLAGIANTAKVADEVLHTVLLNGRPGQG